MSIRDINRESCLNTYLYNALGRYRYYALLNIKTQPQSRCGIGWERWPMLNLFQMSDSLQLHFPGRQVDLHGFLVGQSCSSQTIGNRYRDTPTIHRHIPLQEFDNLAVVEYHLVVTGKGSEH